MEDNDKLLESLGFNVADGVDPDWDAMEASVDQETDRKLIQDLQSLSVMASFYRELRQEAQALGIEAADADPATEGGSTPDRWDHLEILEQIGRGTYGEVYRARDTHLNREVALKLIRGVAAEDGVLPAVFHEGERLARVKHANLVTIHGAAVRDGDLGLWMEFIQGSTLNDLVKTQGPLSGREAILLGIDLCGALAALHTAGLLHRDTKAQNVMREQGGRVVLMDLGAGTEIPGEGEGASVSFSGTPLYMAPELLAGCAACPRADIYSLGVLLYYAVTGAYPVRAQSLAELRKHHAKGERRHLRDVRPDLPAAFIAVVERAIASNPGDRFATAGEMELALSTASGIATEISRPTPLDADRGMIPTRPSGTRRRWVFLSSAVVVLLLATAAFLWPGFLIATGYTVTATLHRVGQGIDEQLLPGARVAPGDRLYLEFEASRALHVYVLAEDDNGESFLLFPCPGQTPANPLPGGSLYRLPPDEDGQRYSWGVSSAGGTEHLLIVASPDALTDFERTLNVLPAPRRAGTPPVIPLNR